MSSGSWLRDQWTDIKGHAKWEIFKLLAGPAMVSVAYWGLERLRQVPFDWWIASVLFLVSLLVLIIGRQSTTKQATATVLRSTSEQSAVATATPPGGDIDAFYRSYDNRFLVDIENDISARAAPYEPGDARERFLIRYTATIIAQGVFLFVWTTVYRSQILALRTLNAKPMGINRDGLRSFYDAATNSDPEYYRDYDFSKWLGFLKNWVLIFEEPGDIIKITVRGREFLKYMLDQGWSETEKER